MKNYITRIGLFLLMLISFTNCEVIGGIFKIGMGVGIFIMIAILALVVFILAKLMKR
jgi:hypothetical protein